MKYILCNVLQIQYIIIGPSTTRREKFTDCGKSNKYDDIKRRSGEETFRIRTRCEIKGIYENLF